MENLTVKVLPLGIKLEANSGENLLELLRRHGIYLSSSCGGHGVCGKCLVKIQTSGYSEYRIKNACQVIVNEEMIVNLSHSNYFINTTLTTDLVRKTYNISAEYSLNPKIKKKFIEINRNSSYDYLSQVYLDIGLQKTSLEFLMKFSYSISNAQFSGWILYDSEELVDWLPSDNPAQIVGCAVDVGTTTIAVELIDLEKGKTLYQGFEINSQIKFGDDVISRISYASMSKENLDELKEAVISTINNLITKGLKTLEITSESIYEIVIAGNSTMIHLLLGISPKSLGEIPFSPIFTVPITLKNKELNLLANPSAKIYTLPAIGSFVGGDITAGLLALNLLKSKENFLFLDLGTNGEIVVGSRGKIIATSTATGPAFEGGRISCGMSADYGAIDHIFITNQDISFTTIGNSPPKGICGSAIFELISLLLDLKVLEPSGKFLSNLELSSLPPKIAKRFRIVEDEYQIVIYSGDLSNKEIYLSSKDIRQFQLACGAIKCGINLLLSYLDISPESINEVYIAGNFGNYVDQKSLIRVGILPPQINPDKIKVVGNTSLLGAKIALLDDNKRKLAEEYVKFIEHIDLATLPNFEQEFIFSMNFPEN